MAVTPDKIKDHLIICELLDCHETSGIDHGTLSGLDDDDHSIYHTDARGDARYYTETELDAGQLDNRYYTETEVDVISSGINHGDLENLGDNDHTQYVNDVANTSSLELTLTNQIINGVVVASSIDHGTLSGLDDDDHTHYTTRTDWNESGFENRTDSTLTWTDSLPDYTLSVQPVGASFNYWNAGIKYTSTGDTVQIDNTQEGMHVIYYDGAALVSVANPTLQEVSEVIRTKCIVSFLYWDVSETTAIYIGEERHGKEMAGDTHAHFHFIHGLSYYSGLGLHTINADGAGVTADAQFGTDLGFVADEDIFLTLSAVTSTTGLPIYYMTGASADWNRHTEAGFSVRTFDGTDATRLAYNQYTGGAWQLTEIDNLQFVLCHVFATTEKDKPMIAVMGQATYGNKKAARAGAQTEIQSLILNDILFPEVKPIATVIFQTALSYSSAVNGKVISTEEGDDYIDWRSEVIDRVSISTTDHGSLTGLGDDDHIQYLLVDGSRNVTSNFAVSGNIELSGDIAFGAKTRIDSPTDGNLLLTNSAGNDFNAIRLGGTTSAYPMIKRSLTGIHLRLADDSNYAPIVAHYFLATTWLRAGTSNQFEWSNRCRMWSDADGNIRLTNWAYDDFGMLQFGGLTDAFPALKRSTTDLQVRLADDSDYTSIAALDINAYGPISSYYSGEAIILGHDGTDGYLNTTKGDIIFLSSPVVGPIQLEEDTGAAVLVDMPVSATPAAGTEMSYAFAIDSTTIATVYAEADSSGGVQNLAFKLNSALVINNITSKQTTNYQITTGDYTILLDGTDNTVDGTLPAAPLTGQIFVIKCVNADNVITVARNGKNIDGAASDITLVLNEAVTLQYDGTEWWII